jgi:CheY-like chemotaxis protein
MAKRVLLADDSLTIQKVVELTFSDSDWDLTVVGDGQKALESVASRRPDLILADVVMPGKNGYEVCEAIKANAATAEIPVVLLSGTFEPFDKDRAARVRADAIITKPFDSRNLLEQVQYLTSSRPAGRTTPAPVQSPPVQPAAAQFPAEQGLPPADQQLGSFFVEEEPAPQGVDFEPGDLESAIAAYEREHGSEPIEPIRSRDAEAAPLFEPAFEPPEEPEEPKEPERKPASGAIAFGAAAFVRQSGTPENIEPLSFEEEVTAPLRISRQGPGFEPAEPGTSVPAPPAAESSPAPPAESSPAPPESVPTAGGSAPAEEAPMPELPPVPPEIEKLAKAASLTELASLVSTMSAGGAVQLSEADMDRLVQRVVEKISDRVVREIAWEVIPDMAEIVIRKRIKELETTAEETV